MLNQHRTIKDNIAKYNKPNPLADFLLPFIGDKKEVKILDVGSGPYSIIGDHLDGVDVELSLIDNQDFKSFYKRHQVNPYYSIRIQDMEDLDYVDNFFDIVTCINALDHTYNADRAVREMIRVCKPGGYVYIDCCLEQLNTGHKHLWNADKDGVLANHYDSFDLKQYGFKVKYIDNGGENRYNHIIATLRKEER